MGDVRDASHISFWTSMLGRFQRGAASHGLLRRAFATNSLMQAVHERKLPPFRSLAVAEMAPALREAIKTFETDVSAIEATLRAKTTPIEWETIMDPLEIQGDALQRIWGIVGHLMSVQNSPALREVHAAMQIEVVTIFTRFSQSPEIFAAYKELRSSASWATFSDAQQRIIDSSIRGATLSGVGLEGEEKERFNQLQLRSAELKTKFSNNVLDATKAYSLIITNKAELDGVPASLLPLLAQNAAADGHDGATAEDGPWKLSLDMPVLLPMLKYCTNRSLRETLYRANATKASIAPHDNTQIINETLRLRQERAKLLGFASYAELSLATKMAPSVDDVNRMHNELRAKCRPIAVAELNQLAAYAAQHGQTTPLALWDVAYWTEKMRADLYTLDDEIIKPYFPLPKVLEGLFDLTSRLFGVTIEAADASVETWHDDVQFFNVRRADGAKEILASFFLDPYARPAEKNGGAWMNTCVGRSKLLGVNGAVRIPVAYLICNQSPPVGDKPSLMNFREVETLFHEFGHGLQHMLTTVDYEGAAGINGVEWDAVELPSQFMENFCYHRGTINAISGHYETDEPLPAELFEKICDARKYMAASGMLRQLNFGALDMHLHGKFDPSGDETIFDVQHKIANDFAVMKPLPEDRFLCSFSHIFAGGYAAGYYSYKWAEVLSCDAFSKFEEAGLDDEAALAKTGREFRDTVLALGGSRHPLQVFEAFRGRPQSTDALLKHYGLQ
ncbi:oligopeptidase A [Saprolegnia diclina VS20]|uniref:oligopeptidase A n=1 Tax=Saprolegnia diclina (strain VS20) TaxID=1156394 RepID=T0QAE3_SAPDV|nr:oligopeptidase A [Saprolegnia diclina VS20]EQC34874.1 oligopeptidase A [Saprolegnia diclina VS20]|eukprot:XP_008611746.1 oligopeptidase A [Saprolegnia diclina VS20]